MKHVFFLIIAVITSTAYAGADYTGIWKDNQGTLYSIHQSNDSIVVGELLDNQTVVFPMVQRAIRLTKKK